MGCLCDGRFMPAAEFVRLRLIDHQLTQYVNVLCIVVCQLVNYKQSGILC